MANKNITLIDNTTNDELYPATLASQVFDSNGQSLQTFLNNNKTKIADMTISTGYASLEVNNFTVNPTERLRIQVIGPLSGGASVWFRLNGITSSSYYAEGINVNSGSLSAYTNHGYDAIKVLESSSGSLALIDIEVVLSNTGSPMIRFHGGDYVSNLIGTAVNDNTLSTINAVTVFITSGSVFLAGTNIKVWKEYVA